MRETYGRHRRCSAPVFIKPKQLRVEMRWPWGASGKRPEGGLGQISEISDQILKKQGFTLRTQDHPPQGARREARCFDLHLPLLPSLSPTRPAPLFFYKKKIPKKNQLTTCVSHWDGGTEMAEFISM